MLTLKSYGCKHRRDIDADNYVDCRRLPNPDGSFWKLPGTDPFVQLNIKKKIEREPRQVERFNKMVAGVIHYATNHAGENLTLAFKCIGGKHRSVYVAEHVARLLREAGVEVQVHHLDISS